MKETSFAISLTSSAFLPQTAEGRGKAASVQLLGSPTLFLSHCNVHHLFCILGGGSALLPAPIPPILLEEKEKLTKMLASRGAAIQELNTVRKILSLLKGGGLARLAYPAQVTRGNLCLHRGLPLKQCLLNKQLTEDVSGLQLH